MGKEKKELYMFIFGSAVLELFFSFLLAGLWLASWALTTKLVCTGFLILIGGTACYVGLDIFWKTIAGIVDGPN